LNEMVIDSGLRNVGMDHRDVMTAGNNFVEWS